MYYIHIYIYLCVFTYIYIYIYIFVVHFFTNYTSNFPTSRIIQSVSSQADVGFASSSFFWGYARYSDWFAIELQGVRCFDVELLKWCTRKRYVVSFLVFLACSECVLVSMSVSMKQLYIQLLLCISKLVPDADSASRSHADPERAPWIDPTIGAHLWDQGAAIFVGTLQTSSAVTTCSWGIPGETLDWFTAKMYERGEWLSESHHLTTCGTHTTCCTAHPSPRPGGAFTVLAVGVAIQSLGTMGTACLQYLSDSQARFVWWSNGRIQILDCVSFGIFSEIQEKSRLDQKLFGHSFFSTISQTDNQRIYLPNSWGTTSCRQSLKGCQCEDGENSKDSYRYARFRCFATSVVYH